MYLFRERLKDLRNELGLDQKEMGKKLNVSQSAYGYYEQGRNEPSLETLVKIARIFDVSTDYLLGISNTRENPVYHKLSEKVSLSDKETETVLLMKKNSLLESLSKEPEESVTQLYRYWRFIQEENNH